MSERKRDNRDQEPWKRPLPEFIVHLYFKTFGRGVILPTLACAGEEIRSASRSSSLGFALASRYVAAS